MKCSLGLIIYVWFRCHSGGHVDCAKQDVHCVRFTDFDPLISECLRSKDNELLLGRFEHIADEQKTVVKIHGFKMVQVYVLL